MISFVKLNQKASSLFFQAYPTKHCEAYEKEFNKTITVANVTANLLKRFVNVRCFPSTRLFSVKVYNRLPKGFSRQLILGCLLEVDNC